MDTFPECMIQMSSFFAGFYHIQNFHKCIGVKYLWMSPTTELLPQDLSLNVLLNWEYANEREKKIGIESNKWFLLYFHLKSKQRYYRVV